jgi:glycosyltransferase involved in cell wall biosynthesis
MWLPDERFDVVMLGTFSVWRLGTLQARALPLAHAVTERGLRVALLTLPWDAPQDAGVRDSVGGVAVINTRSARLTLAPMMVRETVAWLRRTRPAAVHVFKPKGFGGLVASQLLGELPVIVDCDDWEGDGGWNNLARYNVAQRRLFDWQERTLLARADAVTAASTLLAQRARSLRAERSGDSVWRLPNGLSDDWRAQLASGRAEAAPSAPSVLLYSRFAEFGADWLPRFVAALASERSEPVTLRLVGDAPRVEGVGCVAVESVGYVPREALPRLLRSATLGVYPYEDALVTRAKQSVKLLEMMAAGCPVVASDVGDVARTLGAAGVPLPGADPSVFAREVARLLHTPDELRALRERGPARIARHFRVGKLAETLMAVYAACGVVRAQELAARAA